jgi:hypothetical protein
MDWRLATVKGSGLATVKGSATETDLDLVSGLELGSESVLAWELVLVTQLP